MTLPFAYLSQIVFKVLAIFQQEARIISSTESTATLWITPGLLSLHHAPIETDVFLKGPFFAICNSQVDAAMILLFNPRRSVFVNV